MRYCVEVFVALLGVKDLEDGAEFVNLFCRKRVQLVNDEASEVLVHDARLSKGTEGVVVGAIGVFANKVLEFLTGEFGDEGVDNGVDNLDLVVCQSGFRWRCSGHGVKGEGVSLREGGRGRRRRRRRRRDRKRKGSV